MIRAVIAALLLASGPAAAGRLSADLSDDTVSRGDIIDLQVREVTDGYMYFLLVRHSGNLFACRVQNRLSFQSTTVTCVTHHKTSN